MTSKCTKLIAFVCTASASSGLLAASYPSNFMISEAGYIHLKPLHERLSQRQGELYLKDTGLFIGASDAAYQERIESEDHYEVDAYAGIKKDYGLFGYHLGVKSYNRSIAKDIEFQEYFVGGNIKNLSFSYAANNEDGEYSQLNLSHAVSSVVVGVHLGETKSLLGEKYTDWSLHASKAFKDITFNAIMTNTNNPLLKGTEFNLGVEKVLKLF